jgi:hypothetical protein
MFTLRVGLCLIGGLASLTGYGVTSSDVIYYRSMQDSLQATKDLERTIALRPHISTSNYYQNGTTIKTVNSGVISQFSVHAGSPAREALKQNLQQQEKPSWWQRIKGLISPRKGPQGSSIFSGNGEVAYKAMVLGYAFVNFRLFRLSLYLQDQERWYFWRQSMPLAQLITLPQKEVAQSLVADIRQRYGAQRDDQEVANPFGAFLQALEEEAAMLNSYQTLSKILFKVDAIEHRCIALCCDQIPKFWGFSLSYFMTALASKIRVKNLFYLDETRLQTVPERLARLAYIKSTFVNWLAEHKLLVAKKSFQAQTAAWRYSL